MPLNSHTSRTRIDSWNGQHICLIVGTLRKSVIILGETKFNIHDLMGATVTGMIWRWIKRFITVESSESFHYDMEKIFMRSDRISFSERKTAERKI